MGEAKRRAKQAIVKRTEPMFVDTRAGEFMCSGIPIPALPRMGS